MFVGDCYRDEDCQFYYKDSSGLLNGEIVGACLRISSTLSECRCTYPFFGRNCQLKHCPNATISNGLECGGLNGHGVTAGLGKKGIGCL